MPTEFDTKTPGALKGKFVSYRGEKHEVAFDTRTTGHSYHNSNPMCIIEVAE